MAANKRRADAAVQSSSSKRRRSVTQVSEHKNETSSKPIVDRDEDQNMGGTAGFEEENTSEVEETENAHMVDSDGSESSSDSDDAPEEVSKSTATQALHAQEAEKSKAIGSRVAKLREKRRAHDDRLRLQVQTSSRRKRTSKSPESDVESDATSELDVGGSRGRPSRLLPQSLLEAEREPTPPTEDPSKRFDLAIRKSKRTVFASEKSPKDVKKGPLNVRVLSKRNQLLPPKSNGASRSIREKWLQGRSLDLNGGKGGKRLKGGKQLVRREVRRGFLRT
ncbi:hypothetical protein P152DRAFT_458437 [Eremomyces bilateralis CBS 781.70]|uniref:Immediate-early protein n=1 Tax=Eremomyces bilateralis CBS 781.70 TaxID=1392243 RepID=A0A6G1G3Y5_9PEZI|nr:uncharacterized protein P152DRAFT_458437 [Eremomyces bilateralis CBS 781.70]KAF1812616.1 hypothetical protein P152DRAFT_458437 [Eremomyces bilateralis CBS 781.70]